MKCEHAQEFFSEYIEESLDKPSGVMLEAHLTACAACRRDLEGLRQTWGALNAMPAVEPPRDLAWRVMVQLQQERLERLEAERQRRNPFIAWLQSLTPGAAFGYATLTALLLIAVAFPLRGPIEQIAFDIFGVEQAAPTVSPGGPPRPQRVSPNAIRVEFTPGAYQAAEDGLWYYRLMVAVPPNLRDPVVVVSPEVSVQGVSVGTAERRQPIEPGRPVLVPVPVTVREGPVRAAFVRIEAPGMSPIQFYREIPARGARGGM